jgi:pyrophosphate--fructose-6-phosphate 1-phosphotransferase
MAAISLQSTSSAERRLTYVPELPAVFKAPVFAAAHAQPPVDRALAAWLPQTYQAPLVSLGAKGAGEAAGVPSPTAPLRVGVVFCGRQCPGGHNVVAGVFDALQALAPGSELLGFLNGTLGFFAKKHKTLTAADIAPFRNQVRR